MLRRLRMRVVLTLGCALPCLAAFACRSETGVSRGYCAKSCAVVADCCATGAADCPGSYPQNFSCEGGLCRAPRCAVDADCELAGSSIVRVCRALGANNACVRACASDGDCHDAGLGGLGGSSLCSGVSDDGTRICGGTRCSDDNPCLGNLHCLEDGRCGCEDDAECPSGRHCQEGACGCETGAECGPALDACIKDPAFAYPASAGALPGAPG